MRLRPIALAALAALLASVAVGCGTSSSSSGGNTTTAAANAPESSPPGDIPDNQAYVAYSPPGARYSVKVPEGWARRASGGAVTFTDKLNSIKMETLPPAGADTPPHGAGFQAGSTTTVSRPAGTAKRITYLVDSAPDPVTGKSRQLAVERYVFTHGGKAVVLTLSGAKGADNVDPWKIVTSSVRWK